MNYELTVTNEITILIQTIKEEIEKGKQRIEHTIESEKTTTYWNIGKYVYQHLLKYNDRAEYGDDLYKLLSTELHIGTSTLYRIVQFYEAYNENFAPERKLTWSHYKILITVKDEDKRKELEQRVISEDIGKRELQEIVKDYKKDINSKKGKIITESRGVLNIYQLKPIEENGNTVLYIDLGFRLNINKLDKTNKYSGSDIVKIHTDKNKQTIIVMGEIIQKNLYTYKGFVKEIIDGDTLWVILDLGFDCKTTQKVRLKGINAPDIEAKAGLKSKNYLKSRLDPCTFIIVKTYYRDKYNRYLADIFYDKNEPDTTKVAETGVYLNQELLDKGFAEKY